MRKDQAAVIVVGGGAVGACLTLLLAERGVDVILIEQDRHVPHDLRASTFHPPTLDLLAPLGLSQTLLDQGLRCPSWQVRLHPSGENATFDLTLLASDTDHPYRLQCEQWRLTEALRTRLDGRADIRLGAAFVGMTQDGDGVDVEVKEGGEVHRLRCRYLVGCDGVRSAVRSAAEIGFEGTTYPETTILATTAHPFEDHLRDLSNVTYCWLEGGRNFTLLKLPDRWRVSLYPREDVPLEAQTNPDAIEAALQDILFNPEGYDVQEARPYRVHMRAADRFMKGRVALAGDAAHVNSPAGGMGLNGGVHDAFELAEALVVSLGGGEGGGALERYDRRRRPIACDEILRQADRNRARMREQDPARRRALLMELQATADNPVLCKAHLLRTSMIEGLKRAAAIA